ncbi:MAG: DedA family protein [Planctomycetota bacterium]
MHALLDPALLDVLSPSLGGSGLALLEAWSGWVAEATEAVRAGFGADDSTISELFSQLGYLGPFLILVACGFGFPLPEEVTMLGSGFLLYQGRVEAVPIVLTCWAATLIGDSVPYWIGRRWGRSALRFGPLARILHAERLGRLERRFERNGTWAVFVCRFLPGLRLPAWFTAGTLGMRYRRFIAVDGLGAALMTPAFVALGYGSGEKISELEGRVENFHQILGFVVLALVAIIATHLIFHQRPRRTDAPVHVGPERRRVDDGTDPCSDGPPAEDRPLDASDREAEQSA